MSESRNKEVRQRTVEEKLAKSMTAETIELIPHLPYLLQDLWEMGSSPKEMLDMITRHMPISGNTRVLDLACGKGPVSIHLARNSGCKVKGIDIIPDFIDFAARKARELGVGDLCEFVVGDITQSVKTEKGYDVVILGAVGDVLGNTEETLTLLKSTVRTGGFILLDDAYGKDATSIQYPARDQWLAIFDKTGVRLVAEKVVEDDEVTEVNDEQQAWIVKRANELKEKFPDLGRLFDQYIHSQQAECDELENDILGVTLLLQVVD